MLVVLRQLKLRHLLVLFVLFAVCSAFFLRQNNLTMTTLRNEALQADEQNGNVAGALTNLRNYVTTHMNTDLGEGGIYLSYSYQRAYAQAIQAAIQSGSASSVIYQHADQVCRAQAGSQFQAYVQCITDEVVASGSPAVQVPSADLYHYDFLSPAWSLDVAGITLLTAILLAILISSRLLLSWGVYILLRSRHQAS